MFVSRAIALASSIAVLLLLTSSTFLFPGLGGRAQALGGTDTSAGPLVYGASAATARSGSPAGTFHPLVSQTHRSGLSSSARAIEQQIAAGRFPARNAFLPTPFRAFGTPPSDQVTPLQLAGPAPMGLSDLGLGAHGAYSYNTSSFEGTVELSAFSAFSPGYPVLGEAPDWTSIQLNTVGVNISYPGASNGTFWFQNVIHFNGTALRFEDNIWNFSSFPGTYLPSSTFHSGGGQVVANEFYFDYGPSCSVSYPFTLELTNTLAIVGGRPAAFFNYSVAGASCTANTSGSYDEVVFNGAAVVSAPPQFEVNGHAYAPVGTEYDSELIFGGDGGGTNANIVEAHGNLTLDRWNASSDRFESVPSAYDHGVDSAESVEGLAAYYVGTTEFVNEGPSLLYGLWGTASGSAGASAAPGWIGFNLTVTPHFSFVFGTNASSYVGTLGHANLTYVPTSMNGSADLRLPPPPSGNPYVFAAWANGRSNNSTNVTSGANGTLVTLTLSSSPSTVDAPVYLDGDGEANTYGLAGVSGTGYSPAARTLWINQSTDSLAPPFLRVNGFDFPTFVLLAAEDLNLTVLVNGFVQSAPTFEYTFWNVTAGKLGTQSIPGWTQGYYFFGGSGRFSVSNTTLTGNVTLNSEARYTPAGIEFFQTNGSRASGIAATQDSLGVTVLGSENTNLSTISSHTGADSITVVNSTGVVAAGLSANGSDREGIASWAAYVSGGSHDTLATVSASDGAVGVVASGGTVLTVGAMTATSNSVGGSIDGVATFVVGPTTANGSIGFLLNDTSGVTVASMLVSNDGYAGLCDNSTNVRIDELTVLYSATGGFDFSNDSSVTVARGWATGSSSTVVDSFTNSTGGSFSNIGAVNDAVGITIDHGAQVAMANISALNESIAALVTNSTWVNASVVYASDQSAAIVWNGGAHGRIVGETIGNNSTGADLSNLSWVTVRNANASQPTLGAGAVFIDPLFAYLTSAPVVLQRVSNVTVSNVSADEFPCAVSANASNGSVFENITAWNGGVAVQLNSSSSVDIASVFAQGNEYGAYLNNTTQVTVTGSTFEDSASYGIVVVNGTQVHVYANNFVGNDNNSSTSGTFSAKHVQAWANGTDVHFNSTGTPRVGNYWADHTGAAAYTINGTATVHIVDADPVAAFITNWLKFVETGLPPLARWGFQLGAVNYSTYAPLVFIPSWSLPRATLDFAVHSPEFYTPNETSGSVDYVGANTTITIRFSAVDFPVDFVATGLANGLTWHVTFNGSAGSTTVSGGTATVAFSVPNGNYSYSIPGVAGYMLSGFTPSGTITVFGSAVTEDVAYAIVTYNVTFNENGLPNGTNWSVTLNGEKLSASAGTILFAMPNGSYSYVVGSVAGYSPTKGSGSVSIHGSHLSVAVTFERNSSPSSVPLWIYAAGGAAAAVVIGAAVALLMLRRRRRTTPAAAPPGDEPF